jgi:hypothetical protein
MFPVRDVSTWQVVEEVVRCTPKMSDPARRFVVGLLDLNRRRLLGDCH